jgi:hypothetical protein
VLVTLRNLSNSKNWVEIKGKVPASDPSVYFNITKYIRRGQRDQTSTFLSER